MANFQVGDKVVLVSENPRHGMGSINVGDEGVITSIGRTGDFVIDFANQRRWHGVERDIELVKDVQKKKKKDKVADILTQIEARLANIEELLAPKEEVTSPIAETFTYEPTPRGTAEEKQRHTTAKGSPNLKRVLAIVFAKGFVESEENDIERGFGTRFVEYHSNPAKGTVTALIKMKDHFGRDIVELRGVAKLSPGDTYNEYIGRAIALHRAQGLVIPSQLRNAPNPTAPVLGMQINTNTVYGVMTLAERTNTSAKEKMLNIGLFEDLDSGKMKIVNDTGASY